VQWLEQSPRHEAGLHKKFQPEGSFIGFFDDYRELRYKLLA
jgi:hypothetical protein